MSQIRLIEVQSIHSPLNDGDYDAERGFLHMVAVLCEAPDGWRAYEAVHPLAIARWEEDKAQAAAWTQRRGKKLKKQDAARYFHGLGELKFAG